MTWTIICIRPLLCAYTCVSTEQNTDEIKSREVWFAHNLSLNYPIGLKLCTKHDAVWYCRALLLANSKQNRWLKKYPWFTSIKWCRLQYKLCRIKMIPATYIRKLQHFSHMNWSICENWNSFFYRLDPRRCVHRKWTTRTSRLRCALILRPVLTQRRTNNTSQ